MADIESSPAETAAEAVAAPAEATAETVKAKRGPGRPRTARKAEGVKAAGKPATLRKAAAPKVKREKAARPAAKNSRPARGARPTQGVETMTKQNPFAGDVFANEQFRTVFGDVNERTRAAAERSARLVEELADLTRGNVEAVVASSRVAAKAVETLSQEAADYGRRSFEEASTALKSFTEAKSATDLFKLHSDFARAAFDSAVAESARLSETMLKLAGEVAEPLTNRYTVAADRVKSLAA